MDLPAEYDRIDEIISDTVGTLIRVFDGDDLIHEWLAERVSRNLDSDTATISGGGLETVFDRTVLYPFDYPDNQFPNHIYGGKNILQNPGFEDNGESPTIYSLIITADSGTFKLGDGTDWTDPIDFDASAVAVEQAIEADLGEADDVSVTGQGTADNPWVIEFVTPAFGWSLSVDGSGLTGSVSIDVNIVQSGALEPTGWQKAQAVSRGVVNHPYGEYQEFELDSTVKDSGVYSLKVNPAANPRTGGYGVGPQQIVTVKPGGIYQAGFRARPSSATTDIRLAIRGIDQDLIKMKTVNLSTGVFSDVAFNENVTIPVGTTQAIFRAVIFNTATDQPAVWFDNAYMTEGLPASNAGEIWQDLMDDAAVDHAADPRGTPLDWIDYSSFDATNDSSGDAWTDDLSITLYAGMTYGQILDRFVDLGYEWELVAKTNPTTKTHNFRLFKSGNLGTDRTADPNPAINTGAGVLSGPVLRRIPDHTAYLVVGDGVWAEGESDLADSFGRFETYYGYKGITTSAAATLAGTEILENAEANRIAVQFKAIRDSNHPVPLVDYKMGDTLYIQLPPVLEKTARRIHQVSYLNSQPATFDVTGSKVFPGVAGGWEAVRKILRRFNQFDDTPGPVASLGGGGGGEMTVTIAAFNASEMSKSKADFVAADSNIDVELAAALDICNVYGGTIILSEGLFTISPDTHTVGTSSFPVILRGKGWGTALYLNANPTDWGITIAGKSQIRDLALDIGGGD